MKIILLALLVIVGEAAGGKGGGGKGGKRGGAGYGGSPGQRPPPPSTNNNNYGAQNQPSYDYFAPPPPTQNLGGACLAVSPSSTVAAGASVTVTCKFTAPINKKPVFFTIGNGDNMEDSNVLMFDTSSTVGQTMMIAEQVGVVVNDASVSLMYYKAKTSDSGVYQCYIPNVATSNELTVTVTAQPSCNKTTLIVAITVPLVIVLAVVITMLVMRFCCGYRCHGMQFRRMQQPATGAEVEVGKAPDGKLHVLDPVKLPASDVAMNAPQNMYQPPGYDEAVYGKGYDADASVQVKPNGASMKKYLA